MVSATAQGWSDERSKRDPRTYWIKTDDRTAARPRRCLWITVTDPDYKVMQPLPPTRTGTADGRD
jgi:hypothetical protein